MKKIVSIICVLAAAVAFAGADNTIISFSTPGTDKYADGTTVLDGECYALVWTPTGSEFGGILANGEAVSPSKLVFAVPLAKDGKCPLVVFQLDSALVNSTYKNGKFSVYLLDTRLTRNGVVTVGLNAAGKPQTVTSTAKVGDGEVKGVASIGGAVGTAVASEVPEEAKNLVIKSVEIQGAQVVIKATGTVPYLQYGVATGSAPDDLKNTSDAPQAGGEVADEVTFVTAKQGDAQFFKINRK